jgi:tetrahydromethanopterin S-methyltransferase subunit B
MSSFQITDPDEEDIFYDKIPISGKIKEFQHIIEARGVYEMCFELHDGKTPVRVFFHVDYKPVALDGKDLSRVVSKEDVPSLINDLQAIDRKIKEISTEIEHAKRQEAYLNKANGKKRVHQLRSYFLYMLFQMVHHRDCSGLVSYQ